METIMCKPCIYSRRTERRDPMAVVILRGFVGRSEACSVCGTHVQLLVVRAAVA